VPSFAEKWLKMDQWATVTKSDDGNKWGFFNPREFLGKKREDFDRKLINGYSKTSKRPNKWVKKEIGIPNGDIESRR